MKYRNEISHEWQRRHTLRQYRQGVVSRRSLCDAEFILVTASRYHGVAAPYPCPICDSSELRVVRWVYGDQISRASGSARSEEEIAELVAKGREFTVHTVEVCPECRWNHLLKSETAMAD